MQRCKFQLILDNNDILQEYIESKPWWQEPNLLAGLRKITKCYFSVMAVRLHGVLRHNEIDKRKHKTSPGGGIGRRVGLKIRLGSPLVPVQVWLRAF